jgi:hypothetical protein
MWDDQEVRELLNAAREVLVKESFNFCLYLDQPTINFFDQYLELSRAELLQTELTVGFGILKTINMSFRWGVPTMRMNAQVARMYVRFCHLWLMSYGIMWDDLEQFEEVRELLNAAREVLVKGSFDFCLYLDQPTIDFLDQYLELSRAKLLHTELTVEQMAQVDLRRSILWDFEDC